MATVGCAQGYSEPAGAVVGRLSTSKAIGVSSGSCGVGFDWLI